MEAEEQQRPPAEGPGPGPGPRKEEEEDAMDAFLDKFRSQQYRGRLHEDTWEQELEKIPMFMKEAPSEINPQENPELACLQSLIFDDERPPEEQAKTYKDEGNDYFKDRDYKKAVASYTEGLRKKCSDPDLNAMLLTNRAAAQYHLGNLRSALNDAAAARKLRPSHLKAIIRGAICHLELRNFSEAVSWCDEGLRLDSKERKLLEIRVKADKLKALHEHQLLLVLLQLQACQSVNSSDTLENIHRRGDMLNNNKGKVKPSSQIFLPRFGPGGADFTSLFRDTVC